MEKFTVKREHFAIVQSVAASIRIASAMFEASQHDAEGTEYKAVELEIVAKEVKERVSKAQIDNMRTFLNIIKAL